jgi:hypothetical protein
MNTAKPALAESPRESLHPSVESPSGMRAEEVVIRVTVNPKLLAARGIGQVSSQIAARDRGSQIGGYGFYR